VYRAKFEQLLGLSSLSLDRLLSFIKVAESGSLTTATLGDLVKQSQ
jgi:hypothetical protein